MVTVNLYHLDLVSGFWGYVFMFVDTYCIEEGDLQTSSEWKFN